ncbi:MAG: DUF4231 domain-containing protein [Coleofasciculus sp. D1-CHI-01]|mgnify:CR=1 FL=1|uniref:DUF4231 domain-containing protein n=1 Tax=Coleofasciculus sp. D1-CHI-01 TaxID=3068482 RepID=UPI0032FE6EE7
MTTLNQTNPSDPSEAGETGSPLSRLPIPWLKIGQYLFLAALICTSIISLVVENKAILVIWIAVFVSFLVFLVLLDRQLAQAASRQMQLEVAKRAEIYQYLVDEQQQPGSNPITVARENALQYCQELIEDYKKSRQTSRNIYYTFQMATIVFSGITPILVLVDKLDIGVVWFKWLPVIFPAVASIVASVVTSFPFQENWISANTAVELLEAEREKFILGVTQAYRCYDIADESQRKKKLKQAIENFINQVNTIHLKQVQEASKTLQQQEEKETYKSAE